MPVPTLRDASVPMIVRFARGLSFRITRLRNRMIALHRNANGLYATLNVYGREDPEGVKPPYKTQIISRLASRRVGTGISTLAHCLIGTLAHYLSFSTNVPVLKSNPYGQCLQPLLQQ
jgi:hypothetical protein